MKKALLIIICGLITLNGFGQNNPEANQYLSIGTGLTWDNYYSTGPRLMISYSRRFKNKEKVFWGFTIDNKWKGLSGIPSVKLAAGAESPPELDFNHLSFDIHSLSRRGNTRIMFDFSAGLGLIYLHGNRQKSVQPAVNVGMTMNYRIGEGLFLEISPLLIIPPSRITFTQSKLANSRAVYSAWNFIPLGLRFKLD